VIPALQVLEVVIVGSQSSVRSLPPWMCVNIDGPKVSSGEMNEWYLDATKELTEAVELNVLGMEGC